MRMLNESERARKIKREHGRFRLVLYYLLRLLGRTSFYYWRFAAIAGLLSLVFVLTCGSLVLVAQVMSRTGWTPGFAAGVTCGLMFLTLSAYALFRSGSEPPRWMPRTLQIIAVVVGLALMTFGVTAIRTVARSTATGDRQQLEKVIPTPRWDRFAARAQARR